MKALLLIFEKHLRSYTFDITKEQKDNILSLVDYTSEQYKVLSEITGLPEKYFMQDDVDYWVEW